MPSDAISYLLSFPRPTTLAGVVVVSGCVNFPTPATTSAVLYYWVIRHKSQLPQTREYLLTHEPLPISLVGGYKGCTQE